MKSLLLVLSLASSLALAQPSTYPCTPGKVCRPASVYTPGDVTSLNSLRTYDSSNLTNNWRQSTFNGTTSFEQNGGAVFACSQPSVTCTWAYSIATSAITGTSITSAAASTATTYLRTIGVAFGSFPTCNGGIAGAMEYDTTNSCHRLCNGAAWGSCLNPASFINNYWSSVCFGTCSEDVHMTGGIRSQGGSTTRALCSWGTAGTVGGGTGVEINIFDVTAGAAICSCNLGACNIAANTPTLCTCTGTYVNNNTYTFQLRGTTDCAVNPSNIVCTAMVAP